MNLFVFTILCICASISIANGIICVSCVGSDNAGCNDPYNPSTSGNIPVPYNNYCAKVVYPTYVERMASGRSCTSGNGAGNSYIYCCAGKDYCNSAMTQSSSRLFNFLGLCILTILKKKTML